VRAAKQQLHIEGPPQLWLGAFRWHKDPIEVVMLGDSITAGVEWSGLLPDVKILNLGLGGDTSAGILNRLNDVVNRKPRVVFLMIGVNDFLSDIPLDLVATHIQLIALRLAQNGIITVVQSTLSVSNDVGKNMNDRIKDLNNILRTWCDDNAIIYADLNNVLSANDALLPRFSYDGVHLNKEGYVLWREIVKEYIEVYLPNPRANSKDR
jgi:lysophospholipase L1-like esterase